MEGMNKVIDNVGIIIQARMNSTRLPGKIMKKIGTKTILEHIFYRIAFLKHGAKTVVATTISPKDDIVERLCSDKKIYCFRGSEKNVLGRYYLCAKEYRFRNIIRLTGDNPFTDIEELDNLIDLHFKTGADYTNSLESLPEGMGAEIFTFSALEKSYSDGKDAHHIEHVNEYILENPSIFKIAVLKAPPAKSRHDIRLTIDTKEDYEKACYMVKNANNEYIATREAIELVERFLSRESS